MSARPRSRLVVIVRADPVICGHSGEARNLAEAARQRGIDEVIILTWPLEALAALPQKPLDSVLPYSPGIRVERPEPVGDYKVPDGRYTAGMVGRLVELFTDQVPTVCLSLYLSPHANIAMEALAVARTLGPTDHITTVAEAVGSDVTNVVRSCLTSGDAGAAAAVLATYLSHDRCVAVSAYTRDLIVEAAAAIDADLGSDFAGACRRRVSVSYPAVNAAAFTELTDDAIAAAAEARGLHVGGYVLFLSRITPAKGVDDLIHGYARSRVSRCLPLAVAGSGPARQQAIELAESLGLTDRVVFLDDVDDDEKALLMAGCSAYVLPSKSMPEFVETFGIALVEKMLAGGGPVITTATGGIPEAVGDAATIVEAGSPNAIAAALDEAVLDLTHEQRQARAEMARAHALRFDRLAIFDRLFAGLLPWAGGGVGSSAVADRPSPTAELQPA